MKARGTPPESRGLDAEIDGLYRLPLEEFTAARNELAKQAGKQGAEIKALAKPPVAAWAVNQLYWHRRPDYDALVTAAQHLRQAHAAVLGGKTADVRSAGKAHEERVTAALDAVLEILNEAGHPASDTMRQPILTTLRALPSADPPGRLTKTLQPGGFEALAGLSIRGVKIPPAPPVSAPAKPAAAAPAHGKMSARDAKALAKAREAVAAATRTLKHAEHTAQREEFERARTARDAEQAAKAAAKAREALEEAEAAVRAADTAAAATLRKTEAAERRAQQAEEAVDLSRSRLEAAQTELDAIKG
jgi:hypothetical protein